MNFSFQFLPINFDLHGETCLRFREDSFFLSFGHTKNFKAEDQKQYLASLKKLGEKDPYFALHVWVGKKIIGQIELNIQEKDFILIGYVHLYYLISEYRGKGLGRQLDEFASQFFKEKNCTFMRLSVSPSNLHAWRFYEKQGWRDVGERPGRPEVHFMEKSLR